MRRAAGYNGVPTRLNRRGSGDGGQVVQTKCLATFLAVSTMPLAAVAAADVPLRPGAGFPAGMSAKDRIGILNAAGFQVSPDAKHVAIYCGDKEVPNAPGVGSIELTGDNTPEYVLLSQQMCPGEASPPVRVDIIMRRPDGIWQNILSAEGALKSAQGITAGWKNLAVATGSATLAFVHDAASGRYANVSDVQARTNMALAIRPTKYPPATLPTAGWPTPMTMGSLNPGDIAAIFTAAGYQRIAGVWKGCGGTSEAHLFEESQLGASQSSITDLSGDGQPEVMVYDESSECYGQAGASFTIVTPVAGGWKVVFASGEGFPEIRDTRSKAGWLDVVAGGPGFCHALYRNDGKGYQDLRQVAERPGGCSR